MKNYTRLLVWLLIMVSNLAISQTWKGNTSSAWGDATNWDPASVPGVSSTVTIPGDLEDEDKSWPALSGPVNIANLNLEDGSRLNLNGQKITASGYMRITGAIIENSGELLTQGNSNSFISSSEFGGDLVVEITGNILATFDEKDGNTYEGNVTFKLGSGGAVNISAASRSLFKGDLTIERTVSGATNILTSDAATSTAVKGDFSYKNHAGGSTTIGGTANKAILEKAINIDIEIANNPAFTLRRLDNSGGAGGGTISVKTPGVFTITDNMLSLTGFTLTGKHGGDSNLGNNTISGAFTYSDASGSSGALHSYGNTFEGTVDFSFNGNSISHFYESHINNPIKGNLYRGDASFTTGSAASLTIGYNHFVTFEGNLSVTRTASGSTEIFKNDGSLDGDFSYTNQAGGATTIGKSGDIVPIGGKVDMSVSYPGSGSGPGFNLYGLDNSGGDAGGEIDISNPGAFNIVGNNLAVSSFGLTDKHGGDSNLGNNIISGAFTYSDASGSPGVLHSYGNTFEGTVDFSFNGNSISHFYESHINNPIKGNLYRGDASFTTGSAASLTIGYNHFVTFEGNLSVTRTVSGVTEIFKNDGSVEGDFSYTNEVGGATTIGMSGEIVPIGGKVDILTDLTGGGSNPGFNLYGLDNSGGETDGEIDIKKAGTFNIIGNNLAVSSFGLTGKHGGDSDLGDNIISGAFTYSDASGSPGVLHSYGNTFEGTADFSFNGNAISHFYESHDKGATGNVYNGNASFTTGSTASLYIGYNHFVTFEGNLSVTRTASGSTEIFKNDGSLDGDFSYTNQAGGATTIGKSGDIVPIGGKVDMSVSYPGSGSGPGFNLYGLDNSGGDAGGEIDIKKAGTFNIIGNNLAVSSFGLTDKHGGDSNLGNNIISGAFTYSDASGSSGVLYSYGNTFEGTADFSFNGNNISHFYESHINNPIKGNLYRGDASFTTGSAASLTIGYNHFVTFEGNLSVTRTASGSTEIFKNDGSLEGDFSYTNQAGGATTIGKSGDIVPISGKVDMMVNYPGPGSGPGFNLYGLDNSGGDAGGEIDISNPGAFNIIDNNLAVSSFGLTDKHGGDSNLGDNIISGAFTYSDASGSGGVLYSYGNTFEGTANYSFNGNGISHFYESHINGANGNVYKDDATFVRAGTGAVNIAYNHASEFHKNLTFNTSAGLGFLNPVRFAGDNDGTIQQLGSQSLQLPGLIIDKSNDARLLLDSPVNISGTVSFVNGYIQTSESSPLVFRAGSSHSGASNDSHVLGPVHKIGNTAFTFPTGSGGKLFTAAISAPLPSNLNDRFSAEYLPRNPGLDGFDTNIKAGSLVKVFDGGYWDIQRREGTTSNATVTLGYNFPAGYISDPDKLSVAHWGGGEWNDLGNDGENPGDNNVGTVGTAAPVTGFSPFTLASTDENNPLPVRLAEFSAAKENQAVVLQWITTEEVNADYFELEHSPDARSWRAMTRLSAKGAGRYTYTDGNPFSGNNYYRLRITDLDGSFAYSDIRTVNTGSSYSNLAVYPNPAVDYIFVSPSSTLSFSNLELFDISGRKVVGYSESLNGRLDVRNLPSGVYFVKITYDNYTVESQRLVISR